MTNDEKLKELIPEYAASKTELDRQKKAVENQNTVIKLLMVNGKHDKFEAGDYVASYIEQERSKINEEKILDTLKNFQEQYEQRTFEFLGIIKMEPKIDYDALERAIYKGKLPQDILMEIDKATEIIKVPTLRVTKRKKEKES